MIIAAKDLRCLDCKECILKYEQYLDPLLPDSCTFYADKALELAGKEYGRFDTVYTKCLAMVAIERTRQRKYSEATQLYKEVTDIDRQMFGDTNQTVVNDIDNLGVSFFNMNLFDSTEYYWKQSLAMRRELYSGDHPELAIGINNIAYIYRFQERFKEAVPLYREVIAMRKRMIKGDDFTIAAPLNSLAIVLGAQGYFNEAEELYKEAIGIWRRLNRDENGTLASILNNLSELYQKQNRYREAEIALKESYDIICRYFRADHWRIALSLNDLAVLYAGQGRYKKSEQYFRESLAMRRRLYSGDHFYIAITLNELASLYITQGRYEEAEPLLNESLAMKRRLFKSDLPNIASAIRNLALLHYKQKDYLKAEPLQKEALSIYNAIYSGDQPDIAETMRQLAMTYLDNGRFEEAEQMLVKSLEMEKRLFRNDNYELSETMFQLAELYHCTGRHEKAGPLFIKALDMKKNVFTQQSAFLSENEKSEFWNKIQASFEQFHNFAIKEPADSRLLETMYNNMLFSKGMLLNSSIRMRNSVFNSGDSSLVADYERWVFLNEKLARLYSGPVNKTGSTSLLIDTVEKEANSLEKQLSLRSEEFAQSLNEKQATCRDIKKALKTGEAAVEILKLPEISGNQYTGRILYCALIVRPDNPRISVSTIDYGCALENKYYNDYRENILNKVYDDTSYNVFWSGIADKLDNVSKVYLSADGVYNQINLNTLLNPKTQEYVFEETDIHMLTSTKDIPSMNGTDTNSSSTNTVVLFGSPRYKLDEKQQENAKGHQKENMDFYARYADDNTLNSIDRSKICPLPFAGLEIDTIEKIIRLKGKKPEIKKYTGEQATEEALKAVANPGILHIATHGEFLPPPTKDSTSAANHNPENPLMRSLLFLSGIENTIDALEKDSSVSSREDGALTAYEAQFLNLKGTDLTVLSACETGLGDIKTGEGVYGMQRAFQLAGSRNTIISLWTVNDKATQELMSIFYYELFDGKTKREAFRIAQQQIKNKYDMPYYWGAFIMVGD